MVTVTINKPFHVVYLNALSILPRNGFYIKESSEESHYITANKKGSILSFGETVEITFEKIGVHQTKASINSYSTGIQLIDWGVNKENEQLIKTALEQSL